MLSKNNIWRFRALDKDGKPVESAPKMSTFTVRGPGTKAELIRGATILLNSHRADAMRIGLEDPGYKLDESSIEPLGHTDNEVGFWRTGGAAPLDLPTDAAVRAEDRKFLAEKMGVEPDDIPEPERGRKR